MRRDSFLVALWSILALTPQLRADDAGPRGPAAIAGAIGAAIASREISGAVTVVADAERVLDAQAAGLADIAAARPMKEDSIFWIASMTKPVTAVALLLLQDDGKLTLDDPVGKHIPELASLKTRDGEAAVVTLRHLLTHTSGLAEITLEQSRGIKDLAGLIPLYAAKPLGFKPGERWAYCQSSINTAGRVVEVTSGMSFVEFLEARLFKPLGMKDTAFYLTEEQAKRLARPYSRTPAGELEAAANFILLGKEPTSTDRFPAANGGLFSTAADYARFCRMVLRGGELDGKRYLKPETVKVMTSVQTGDLKTGFTDGNGWGIGWCVVRQPQGPSGALSPGSFGHGGAHGTQAWIDPVARRAYILLVARANFPNADASDVRQAFQAAAATLKP